VVTREQVEAEMAAVAGRLRGVRPTDLPTFENRDGGYPFIRIEGDTLLYLAHERGKEVLRRETTDLDELLWFVFHDVTSGLAQRRGGRSWFRSDSRRRWFPRWIKLMTELDPAWGARTRAYVDDVLAWNPYMG
jgi:hypothetical protein